MSAKTDTVVGFYCSHCDARILQMFETDKPLSDRQLMNCQRGIEERHKELHENANKYHALCGHIEQMAQITGEVRYGN